MTAPDTTPKATGTGNRPTPPSKVGVTLSWVAGVVVFLACVVIVDAKWERLLDLPADMWHYIDLMQGGLWHPWDELGDPTSRSPLTWGDYWVRAFEAMLESIYMAWIGTLIGAALSFPLGFLAASNVAPRWVVFITRQILNAIRAIPEFFLAIIVMVPIFGLGPDAAAIALGVGSIGSLGKLTSEVIEGIDPGPVEAARAAGANPVQSLRWSVVPQMLPETVAFWLYRFEINIRNGAVLGVLGAGGIGSLLVQLFNRREWERIGLTLVVVILVTMIVDAVSGRIRANIIRGPVPKEQREAAPRSGPAEMPM